MGRLLTQAQFARRMKYSRGRISQLVKGGVIKPVNGKIDPVQAEAAISANIDVSRQLRSKAASEKSHRNDSIEEKSVQLELLPHGNNGTATNLPSLTEAKRDHELLKMQLTETQIQERSGNLVPKGEAAKWLIALGSASKLAFMNLPKRLAPDLKLLTDEKEIEFLLRSEIQKIIFNLLEPLHAKPERSQRKNPARGMGDHLETSG